MTQTETCILSIWSNVFSLTIYTINSMQKLVKEHYATEQMFTWYTKTHKASRKDSAGCKRTPRSICFVNSTASLWRAAIAQRYRTSFTLFFQSRMLLIEDSGTNNPNASYLLSSDRVCFPHIPIEALEMPKSFCIKSLWSSSGVLKILVGHWDYCEHWWGRN